MTAKTWQSSSSWPKRPAKRPSNSYPMQGEANPRKVGNFEEVQGHRGKVNAVQERKPQARGDDKEPAGPDQSRAGEDGLQKHL